MNTNYDNIKYDAFISYRHTSPDMEIAEKLHTLLETSKPPKGFKKIKRVFRDRDELPTSSNLADSILEALKNSGYLIVICSPRTPLSQWVIQEIVTFRKLHGNDRILALLIEGEPEESFPKELLYVDGVQVEPLAADIRAKDLKTMKKKLKVELLRLLAPIYGCNFDDLKQRHRARKMKRIAIISACITVFSLLFGSFSLRQAILLQDKTDKLEKSEIQLVKANDDLTQTNDLLATQNDTLEQQMNEILIGQSKYIAKAAMDLSTIGDSRTAILLATEALPSNYEHLDRPYVPEAEYALYSAINPYKLGSDFTGDFYAHHSDGIESMKLSPDNKYVVSQTLDEQIYVWDLDTQEILYKDTCLEYSLVDNAVFVPDTNELIYISETGLQQVDFLTGQVIWNSEIELANFQPNFTQDVIIGQGYSEVIILDSNTGQVIKTLALDLNIREASFDEVGQTFICEDFDQMVKVFEFNKNNEDILKQVMEIDTLYKNFVYYGISNDGQTIFVSSNDYSDSVSYKVGKGEIKLYNLISGDLIKSITKDNESFMEPMFNKGDSTIIHWYSDTLIHSYNFETDLELPYMAHGEVITQMATSLDGSLLMASAYDQTIRYFEVETGTEYEFARFSVPGGVDDFNISGNVLVTLNKLQEDFIVWKNNEGPSLSRFNKEASIDQAYYIQDNQCISISYDGQVSLWDTQTMEHLKVIDQYDSNISSQYFSDTNTLLLIDDNGNAKLYDASSFEVISETSLKSYSSYTSAINPDTGHLAYVDSNYNAVILYDNQLNFLSSIPIENYVSKLTYSEDNEYICLYTDEATKLYKLSDTKSSLKLRASDYCSFSSNSDLIVIAYENTLELYDKTSPKEFIDQIEFDSSISALKFNPKKDEILVALADESLYLYNCDTKSKELIDNNLDTHIASIEFKDSLCITSYDFTGRVQFRDLDNYVTISDISSYLDLSPDETNILFRDYKSLLQAPKLSPEDLIELGKTIVGNRVLSQGEKQTYSITTFE